MSPLALMADPTPALAAHVRARAALPAREIRANEPACAPRVRVVAAPRAHAERAATTTGSAVERLAQLLEVGPLTLREAAAALDISPRTVENAARRLRELGRARPQGKAEPFRGAPPALWALVQS